MTTVARQTLDILQFLIAHRSFYRIIFGRYEDRAYITDGAFLVFLPIADQEAIMRQLNLRRQPGTYYRSVGTGGVLSGMDRNDAAFRRDPAGASRSCCTASTGRGHTAGLGGRAECAS